MTPWQRKAGSDRHGRPPRGGPHGAGNSHVVPVGPAVGVTGRQGDTNGATRTAAMGEGGRQGLARGGEHLLTGVRHEKGHRADREQALGRHPTLPGFILHRSSIGQLADVGPSFSGDRGSHELIGCAQTADHLDELPPPGSLARASGARRSRSNRLPCSSEPERSASCSHTLSGWTRSSATAENDGNARPPHGDSAGNQIATLASRPRSPPSASTATGNRSRSAVPRRDRTWHLRVGHCRARECLCVSDLISKIYGFSYPVLLA